MRFVWLKERKNELKEYIELFVRVFGEVTNRGEEFWTLTDKQIVKIELEQKYLRQLGH